MAAKATRFELRVSEDFKERVALAAQLTDESVSDFVRHAVEARTERVLQSHRATRVAPEFFDELLAALDQPPEPNEALSRAFARVRDVVERG